MEDNLRRTHPKTCKYSEGLETRISLNFPPNNPTGQGFLCNSLREFQVSYNLEKASEGHTKTETATQAKGKHIESQSLWYTTSSRRPCWRRV